MHLDEELVQRLLHGELDRPAETSARDHLVLCDDCRGRVADAEREEAEVLQLLRHLDHPAPRVDPREIAARWRTPGLGWGRQAAAILLGLGLAGVAYAAPGSPVAGWVRAVAAWVDGGPTQPAATPPASTQATDPAVPGIAVSPGRRLVILFPLPPAKAEALVSLTDSADVVVRAVTGDASFSSEVDRLVIESRDSAAAFEIQVPRSAPWVEIRAAGSRIFLKQGPRVTTEKPPAPGGTYILRLTPHGP